MKFNPAGLAIPAFFIFVGIEYFAAVRQNKKNYFSFDSSVSNLTIGIAERLMSLFVSASFYALFEYIYRHWALFSIPDHWLVWVALILATDLLWYWYHRLGHEINILWAAHVVHHQSEEFNYTVSARITVFQSFIRNIFWCVLPLVGFHPSMVLTILVLHGTYSFFTHTRTIGKLGLLEYIFVTPSHHRVHHASEEKYLNKNYGDIFIFWDKLFGSFQQEEEEPTYGLTHPLKSHSFIWQHFHYFAELAAAATKEKNFSSALGVIFGRPEMIDPSIRSNIERRIMPRTRVVRPTFNFKAYLNVQLFGSTSLLFILISWIDGFDLAEKVFASSVILITMINSGALLGQRRWIFYLEYIRLLLILGWFSYWAASVEIFITSLASVSLFLLILPIRQWYWRFIYQRDFLPSRTSRYQT